MKYFLFLLSTAFSYFQVKSQPVINSFSPVSGPAGTTVTILGTGFGQTAAANLVYFGGVQAKVTIASDTMLQVTVPAEATFSPLTVTTNYLTGYSVNSFIITAPGGGSSFTSSSFLPVTDITVGNYPHSVTAGDFNNDGKIDLLISKGSSSNIGVLANQSTPGNILFGAQQDIPASGLSHEGAAVADFDGDGKLDVVLANSFNPASMSVYKNISTGSAIQFNAPINYAADSGPYTVAVGDIDGDGKPDIILANNGSNVISFYKNTSSSGNISFADSINFTAGTNPYSVAVRDLDGDGKADIAVTTQGSTSSLLVMRNTTLNGIVSFDNAVNVASLSGGFTVSVGDLDNDGKPDLAVANGSGAVTVVKNVSTSGTFSFYSPQIFNTGKYLECIAMADLDMDGKPDLITSDNQSNQISVLRNTSTPGNISFESHVDYTAGAYPIFVAVADLDGDGRPDIINANSSANAVSIYKNIIGENIVPVITSFTPASGINGTIVKISGTNFTGASSVKFGGVEAASFVVDSATGITAVAGAGASGDVSVSTANGTASLPGFIYNGPVIQSYTPVTGVTGKVVTINGLNFTGTISVTFGGIPASLFTVDTSGKIITAVVSSGASGSVTVTTSNGIAVLPGFTFDVPVITSFTPASGFAGSNIIITGKVFSAVPGDNIVFFGAVKALVSSASDSQLQVTVPAGAVYAPLSVTTSGLTAFSSKPFIPEFQSDSAAVAAGSFSVVQNYGTGLYPFGTAIADLNNDGKPDLITVNGQGNSITIFKNTSTIGIVSFNTKNDYAAGASPNRVTAGDLNGDGKTDIVVTNANSGNASTISIFENTSSGDTISLSAKTDISTGNGSGGTAIADMDGDGKPDIIVGSGNSGIFSFLKNTTTPGSPISFAPKVDYTFFDRADNLTIADVDNDGRPDLIIADFSASAITIFPNTSSGGVFFLGERIDYDAGTAPGYITTGDLDGDGKVDIIVTNYSSGTIGFYKNLSTPGNISFAPAQTYPIAATNVAVADLNGDGKLDLFAGVTLKGVASVLQNTYNGSGNFSFGSNIDFTTGTYDTYTAVADLDGDGIPELVVTNTIPNSISILKSTITNKPMITSVSTDTGKKQASIIINGTNFTGITAVTFGGTPAVSFTVVSLTKIIAVVGGGASGNISVTNAGGASAYSGFTFIPQIFVTGPVNFCKDNSVLLTSSSDANNQWYKDGSVINNATSNTYTASAGGTYSVQVSSNGIATADDSDIYVSINAVQTPVITADANNNLISDAPSGNQWYLNGVSISGAIAKMYMPTVTGSYTVKDSSNDCSSDFSLPYSVTLAGVISLGDGKFINYYPNPVVNELFINWNVPNAATFSVQISDINGNKVFLNISFNNGNTIDLSKLNSGMYIIKFYNSQLNISKTAKFIKE